MRSRRTRATARERSSADRDEHELEDLQEQARALRERVKELRCLHAISTILENREASLRDVLSRVVAVVPSALQHPGRACARLVVGDEEYVTPGYRPGLHGISSPIRISGGGVGRIEAAYRTDARDGDATFLEEEKRLLNLVAHRITDIVRIKTAEETLRSYQQQLRSLATQLATAQERERRSIAIFLHDRIGQALILARLQLRSVRATLPEPGGLEPLEAVLDETLRDVRSLTFEVSPPVLYELGFEAALEWLAEQMGPPFGMKISVELPKGALEISEQIRAVLFRSVRELVTNAGKHAAASHVHIRVARRARQLVVEVEDDGRGFDVDRVAREGSGDGGFGLFSMREQLGALGGRVQLASSPGQGCCVRMSLPLAVARGGE